MTLLDFDFLANRYDFELARKDKLTEALGLPIAVLSALGGLIGVMARGFSYSGGRLWWWFAIAIVADCCAFSVSLFFLGCAFYRQEVAYLQTPGDLKRAWNSLRRTHVGKAEFRFTAYLRRSMIAATDLNVLNNERRSGFLYRARVALLLVVVLTGLAGIPYVVDQIKHPAKSPTVHIDNLDTGVKVNAK